MKSILFDQSICQQLKCKSFHLYALSINIIYGRFSRFTPRGFVIKLFEYPFANVCLRRSLPKRIEKFRYHLQWALINNLSLMNPLGILLRLQARGDMIYLCRPQKPRRIKTFFRGTSKRSFFLHGFKS